MEVFCGIGWAETHHDVAVVDENGRRLAKQRITDEPSWWSGRARRAGTACPRLLTAAQ